MGAGASTKTKQGGTAPAPADEKTSAGTAPTTTTTQAAEPKAVAAAEPREPAKLIDGKALADARVAEVKREVDALAAAGAPAPCLAVVLLGDSPAALSYIKRKQDVARTCGVVVRLEQLPEAATHEEVVGKIQELNGEEQVHGIIVEMPLPAHLDAKAVTAAVAHSKDVDGLSPTHMGTVALNGHEPVFCPCTPMGCLHLIKSVGVPLRGREAVVVGASNIVGIPMALLLMKEGCTVCTCHIDTDDPASHARKADILVVAVGKAHLVTKDWIKPGAIVIDVGINFVDDASKKSGKRMVGDVLFSEAQALAGHITPVPGGVGPMTTAVLMQNTLAAMKSSRVST
mmetsp:Transcript_29210/g.74245  ORF Transcript_29210/g.74245 Transcript_29210/m.74245 type:complete len:343 (+) Transcript_29210:75-1103(+)